MIESQVLVFFLKRINLHKKNLLNKQTSNSKGVISVRKVEELFKSSHYYLRIMDQIDNN